MKGILYGIGVGVGDPEMLTIKAVKILNEVDIIAIPESKKGMGSTAYNIAKEYIDIKKEIVYLEFPMLKDIEKKQIIRKTNAKILEEKLNMGKSIAFLTIGDPMTYSTYSYIMEYLDKDIKVETIAGITSFHNIASKFNTPLVIGDEDLKIISLNKNTNIIKEIENSDNIVFMKITRDFEKLKTAIKKTGNSKNIILVSNCGKTNEKIYTDIDKLEEIPYFSTLILKKGGINYV